MATRWAGRGLVARTAWWTLSLWSAFCVNQGASSHALEPYWRTSHSLAVLAPRLPSDTGEEWDQDLSYDVSMNQLSLDGPWWWLIGVPGHGEKRPDWSEFVEAFLYEMSSHDALRLSSGRAVFGGDSWGVPDPKVQTVRLKGGTVFRAIPRLRCDNTSEPPPGSFMPNVLPRVQHDACVVELCNLEQDSPYRISLLEVKDGSALSAKSRDLYAEGTLETREAEPQVDLFGNAMKAVCVTAMLLAMGQQAWAHRVAGTAEAYSQLMISRAKSVSGFTKDVVTDQTLEILRDLARCLTIFLPLVGPLGLFLAADVLIGIRIRRIQRAVTKCGEETGLRHKVELARNLWMFVLNALMIPLNMYLMQMIWFVYNSHWYWYLGLGSVAHTSYGTLQRRYQTWLAASGLEIIGWVPGIVLSVLLLSAERQSERVSQVLRQQKERLEDLLRATPKGGKLYQNLCAMEGSPFDRCEHTLSVREQLGVSILSLLFGLLPHIWMCLRHGVPFWNGQITFVTLVYVLNVGGVTSRFLGHAIAIVRTYEQNCFQLALFQALSWKEDRSMAIYDPFGTRNDEVVAARVALKENELRMTPLNLEDPAESKVWWHLREIMLTEMKVGRVRMEVMVVTSVGLTWFAGASALMLMLVLEKVSATTIVSAAVMTVMVPFAYTTLRNARDINLMVREHTSLLHNVVAEANMPLRPQRPLDSHLQQERFLLQLATLIESQDAPESVASFPVTPQFFSAITDAAVRAVGGVLGALLRWPVGELQHLGANQLYYLTFTNVFLASVMQAFVDVVFGGRADSTAALESSPAGAKAPGPAVAAASFVTARFLYGLAQVARK